MLIKNGRNCKFKSSKNGYFNGPTLFDNVTKEMQIYKDEIFGPVVCVVSESYDEA